MSALLEVFADAQGLREEAARARNIAETACGTLQSELLEIAALYDHLADGRDPNENGQSHGSAHLARPAHRPLDESQRAIIAAKLANLMLVHC
jgi:hypothetical protein